MTPIDRPITVTAPKDPKPASADTHPLARIAQMSGAEFLATLDPVTAPARFRAMLANSAVEQHATVVADRYDQFCRDWQDTDPTLLPPGTIMGLEVVELAGMIKWFDASKGYGFIVPDNGGDDERQHVLLHVTCLRAAGYEMAYEGARVHFQALRRPKGMQAFRILSMDETTAIHPAQLPQRTHVVVQPVSGWEKATVKWFNRIRGFGFLSLDDGQHDVFVHLEVLRRFGFTELRPGLIVQVRWGVGSKGRMAAELRPDGEPIGLNRRR